MSMFSKPRTSSYQYSPQRAVSADPDPLSIRPLKRARDPYSKVDAVFLPSSESESDDASSSSPSSSSLPFPPREPTSPSLSPVSPTTQSETPNRAAYTVNDLTQLRRDRLFHRNMRRPSFPVKPPPAPRGANKQAPAQLLSSKFPRQLSSSAPQAVCERRTSVIDSIHVAPGSGGGEGPSSHARHRFQGRVEAARKRPAVVTGAFGRVAKPVLAVKGAQMETGLSWFGRKVYAVGKGGYGVKDVSSQITPMGVRRNSLAERGSQLCAKGVGNLRGAGTGNRGIRRTQVVEGGGLQRIDRRLDTVGEGEEQRGTFGRSREVMSTVTPDSQESGGGLYVVREREPSFLREDFTRGRAFGMEGDYTRQKGRQEGSPRREIEQRGRRRETLGGNGAETSIGLTKKYCVKATCRYGWENSTRCVFIAYDSLFERLKQKLREAFVMKKPFDICYEDEDGDVVRMSSELDMAAFNDMVRNEGGRVRVRMVQPNVAAVNPR